MHGVRKPSAKDTFDAILAADDRDELERWLRSRPLLHTDTALGATLVHAGIHPHWSLAEATALAEELHAILPGRRFERFVTRMYGDAPARWSPSLGQARAAPVRDQRVHPHALLHGARRARSSSTASRPPRLPGVSCPGTACPAASTPARDSCSVTGRATRRCRRPACCRSIAGCVWGGTLVAHALESGRTVSVRCR